MTQSIRPEHSTEKLLHNRAFLSIHELGVELTAALSSFTLAHGVSSLFRSRKRLN